MGTPVDQKIDVLDVRVTRWTALEGGEIFVLRKINNDWSGMLMGDGSRFSCLYQKSVQPRSDRDTFWWSLQRAGLLEIPDGIYSAGDWTDGSGFNVEVTYLGKLKRYSFFLPQNLITPESKKILNVGDLISREFNTPVFRADYNRGTVGDYLINNCHDLKKK